MGLPPSAVGPMSTASDDSQDARILLLNREADAAQRVNWLKGGLAPSPTLVLRLKYIDVTTSTMTMTSANQVLVKYNANNLYQHLSTASGPESIPPLVEFSTLYNRALVMSVKYKVTFTNNSANTQPCYVWLAFIPYTQTVSSLGWGQQMLNMFSGANKTWVKGTSMGTYNQETGLVTVTKEKYLADLYGDEAVYVSTPQTTGSTVLDFANKITNPMVTGNQPTAMLNFVVGVNAATATNVSSYSVYTLITATLITRFSRFNILAG